MKEIVNRLTENRQIELAKSILESNGYSITEANINDLRSRWDHQDDHNDAAGQIQTAREIDEAIPDSEVVREDCHIYFDGEDLYLNVGENYPLSFHLRTSDSQVYEKLKTTLESSVGKAIEYCMRNGFVVSYQERAWIR